MRKMDLLLAHCGDMGIEVEWHDLGTRRRGDYCHALRLIRLNHRLTTAQALASLSHETAHGIFGDTISSQSIERRADEIGASLIITASEYADAESEVGAHPGALADALGVTPRCVLAWRRWYVRQPVRMAA